MEPAYSIRISRLAVKRKAFPPLRGGEGGEVEDHRLTQAGCARVGVPQAAGPLQPPHRGGHRVHPGECGSGVGEVGG